MIGSHIFDFFTSRLIIVTSFFLIGVVKCHDVWEQDLTKDMNIGLADGGYEKVRLKCGADSMQVDLVTEDEFTGVIYTRGSFHKKQPPCFLDPGEKGGRSFSMKFPLDKCQTLNEDGIYSNVLVVQYDKDLIMPGDAAFNLECDFSSPRDVTVSANLHGKKKKVTASRISLANADPASNIERNKRSTIESYNETVELTPEDVRNINLLRKEEL